MDKIICKVCGYEWNPRVEKPKKCAKCLRWIKYPKERNAHPKNNLPSL